MSRCRAVPVAGTLILAAVVGLVATAGAAGPAAQATRTMTPDDVARLRNVGSVAIHPEGDRVAYTLTVPRDLASEDDGPAWTELHLVGMDGEDDRALIPGQVNISHLRWSPDGAWLGYLASRDDGPTAVWALPMAGGESRKLVGWETGITSFEWRPDGGAIAFVADEPVEDALAEQRAAGFDQEIYEEDYRSQRAFVVEFPGGPGGEAGEPEVLDGVPGHPWNLAWSPDGQRLVVDPSPTPLVDDLYMFRRLKIVGADDGAVRGEIDNPGKLGEFAFAPDGESVAMISAADLHDTLEGRLTLVSPESEEPVDLLPDLEGHVEDFAFLPGGEILYLASLGVGTRLGIVDPESGEDRVLHQGSELVFEAVSADGAGDNLALVAHSATVPREVFALRRGAGAEPRRLTRSNPWLSEVRFGEQELFEWTARDGLEIQGLLIHPVDPPDGPAPMIVNVHGGPESHYKNGWLTSYSMPGQVAAGEGFAVFYPNYRGSTGRGPAFSKAHQNDGGGAEFDDVLDGMDALVERGGIDADRIGITGGSYGGYFTAWGATRHSERFAAGVMFVGISDQLSKTGTSDIPRELELVHWRTTPYENPDLFLERSPVLHVDNARTPLLILHGKEDPRVNPGQSMEMYRALKMTSDVPVRLVLYPGEGHGNRRAASRYDYNLRMMRWFRHYLAPRPPDEMPPWRMDYGLKR